MTKSKLLNANKKIENAVVGGYKKIEKAVVSGYTRIEDKFVDSFLVRDGENIADTKERLRSSK